MEEERNYMGTNRPMKDVEAKTGADGQPDPSEKSANRAIFVLGVFGVVVFFLVILALQLIREERILGISVPALIIAGYYLVNGLRRRMR